MNDAVNISLLILNKAAEYRSLIEKRDSLAILHREAEVAVHAALCELVKLHDSMID